VSCYWWWVSSPPSRYAAQFQEVVTRQRKRLHTQQSDQSSNAYDDPRLGPVLRGAQPAGDVHAGLTCSRLVVPSQKPFQVETLCASDASALDLLHFAAVPGSWLDSLAFLQANLKVRQRAYDSLNLERMQAPQLELALAELERTQLRSEDYVQAFEGTLLGPTASPPHWFRFPGLKAREERLFRNDYMAQLERVRAGESFASLPPDAAEPDWDWVCGRHGLIRSAFLAPAPECHDQFEQARHRQAFLHLLAAVLKERALTGQWPVSLREIQTLPELDRKAVEYNALGEMVEIHWLEWGFTPRPQ